MELGRNNIGDASGSPTHPPRSPFSSIREGGWLAHRLLGGGLSQLILIVLCSFALRLGFVILHQRPVASDELEYHLLAKNLVETGSYSSGGKPTAFRPPGYPFFVTAVYFFVQAHPLFPRIVQTVLDSITVLLLFFLARPYGERIALLAATFWAFFLPAVLYTNLLLSETLYVFLIVLSSVLLLRWDIGFPKKMLLTGALIGFAALIKPGTLLFVLFLFFLFRKEKILPKHSLAFVAGILLILAPWVTRNYHLFERPMISSNTGINLFVGHNPATTGGYRKLSSSQILASARDEKEFERVSMSLALEYIAENPSMVVVNGFKKLAYFFGMEGELLVWSFHPNFTDTSTRFAVKYSSLPLLLGFAANAPYAALLLAGVVGLIGSKRDSLSAFFLLFLATLATIHFIFFGGSRFHFPLMPFLAVYASLAVLNGKSILAAIGLRSKVVLTFIVLALIALWIGELVYVYTAS